MVLGARSQRQRASAVHRIVHPIALVHARASHVDQHTAKREFSWAGLRGVALIPVSENLNAPAVAHAICVAAFVSAVAQGQAHLLDFHAVDGGHGVGGEGEGGGAAARGGTGW